MIAAEPAYILLAAHGHPDAHEHIRSLTLKSQQTGAPLTKLIVEDKELQPYLKKFTKSQLEIIKHPENYLGLAERKVNSICQEWEERLTDI
jgi:adenylosuccinate lyase